MLLCSVKCIVIIETIDDAESNRMKALRRAAPESEKGFKMAPSWEGFIFKSTNILFALVFIRSTLPYKTSCVH